MRPSFRYALDPICWLACVLYVANRVWLANDGGGPIASGYFNDFLMIPCALPFILWVHCLLGWREKAAYPTLPELLGHLIVWSIVAEGIGPMLIAGAVSDFRDVLAYAGGALVAGLWWQIQWDHGLSFRLTKLRPE
ncbi:hypothetical protein N9B57_03745 [Verrucomicrobia bacterium]|jgi:hypothetical protein|nr:hypothetical protein [Verrucomicrobiota bacterium]MDA7867030.1 hypothetical protein [Verrucomicrobiota bacterium]